MTEEREDNNIAESSEDSTLGDKQFSSELSQGLTPLPTSLRMPAGDIPRFTVLLFAICVLVFIGIRLSDDPFALETLKQWGFLQCHEIWQGGYYALLAPAVIHQEIWHVAFNLYWLWVLGGCLERTIGTWKFVIFVVLASVVSSGVELAWGNSTGIGASGFGYAIFGFMWMTRSHYEVFRKVLTSKICDMFLAWLVLCVVATVLDVMNIANAAHFSGMSFGCAVAYLLVLKKQRLLAALGMCVLMVAAILPLFWSPWSVPWLIHKAYETHCELDYTTAISYYTRIIAKKPDYVWAYESRARAYQSIGETEKGAADWKKAQELKVLAKSEE